MFLPALPVTVRAMTAMRVERAPARTFVARPDAGSWQSFDVQLAFYALALAVIGLLLAWSNSPDGPLASGSLFTRGLMWFASRHRRLQPGGSFRLPLAAHVLVAPLPDQHRPAAGHDGDRRDDQRCTALGFARRADLPVLGDLEGTHDCRPGGLSGRPSGSDRQSLDADWRRSTGCTALRPDHDPARPRYFTGPGGCPRGRGLPERRKSALAEPRRGGRGRRIADHLVVPAGLPAPAPAFVP